MAANAAGDYPSSAAVPIPRVSVVPGPIIVGAGPSGLAVAASLRLLSVPSVIIERSDGIAHLWRHYAYDRLSLHLPKHFCELPHRRFPSHFPNYPSKSDFVNYLQSYADEFGLRPVFNCTAVAARFDPTDSLWRVLAAHRSEGEKESTLLEYVSPWLVVATGENAEPVVPEMKGKERYKGAISHSSRYRSGETHRGKRVLVVGCGNSGMEMCLDLSKHGAMPFMSIRGGVHLLPREMLGTSTFGLAVWLLKWLPMRLVDKILLVLARLTIGDTEQYGLKRPEIGPMELKSISGKTPVLDAGTLSLIRNGRIKVVPEVETLTGNGAKFADGREMEFDSVIFATGYTANVPLWLKYDSYISKKEKPKTQNPSGWKGDQNGLYYIGFSGRGIAGAGADAVKAAADIAGKWKSLSQAEKIKERKQQASRKEP